MSACLICLDGTPPDAGRYHAACLRGLFGTEALPRIDLDLQHLPARVEPEIGRMSISGAQRKALMRLSRGKESLVVATRRSRFILKPQIETYVHVPENEHASMLIARLAGMEVPPFGLFHLTDGSLCYVIRRYDRTARGKLHQEDFCQLSGRPASARMQGTTEECAALVAGNATEPEGELRRLFLHLLVAYWIGNEDLHLKNLSMLRGEDGAVRLAPAYDLVCTRIYNSHARRMVLTVGNRNDNLPRRQWLDFAEQHARMTRAEAGAVLDALCACTAGALALLARSPLPEPLRNDYARVLRKRSRALA